MHALIGTFQMDPSRRAEHNVELHERIIPMTKSLPGFVSAAWSYDPATSKHYSHLLCERREVLEQLAAMIRIDTEQRGKAAGVAVESLVILDLIATASK